MDASDISWGLAARKVICVFQSAKDQTRESPRDRACFHNSLCSIWIKWTRKHRHEPERRLLYVQLESGGQTTSWLYFPVIFHGFHRLAEQPKAALVGALWAFPRSSLKTMKPQYKAQKEHSHIAQQFLLLWKSSVEYLDRELAGAEYSSPPRLIPVSALPPSTAGQDKWMFFSKKWWMSQFASIIFAQHLTSLRRNFDNRTRQVRLLHCRGQTWLTFWSVCSSLLATVLDSSAVFLRCRNR